MVEYLWKQITGYSDYSVNELGEVMSYKGKNELKLKPYIDKDGYEVYRLTADNGERKAYKGHRIVANMFIENPENLPQVNHINGNKKDNRLSNLEWVTNSKNIKHAWETGLLKGSPYGIIVYDTIRDKEVSYFNGYENLAALLDLSKLTLYDIVCNNNLLYGAFQLRVTRNLDYSEEELFEHAFIHRNINGRFKPYRWNGIVFENTKRFQEHTGLSTRKFRQALENKVLEGQEIIQISHYEYVIS